MEFRPIILHTVYLQNGLRYPNPQPIKSYITVAVLFDIIFARGRVFWWTWMDAARTRLSYLYIVYIHNNTLDVFINDRQALSCVARARARAIQAIAFVCNTQLYTIGRTVRLVNRRGTYWRNCTGKSWLFIEPDPENPRWFSCSPCVLS